MILRTKPTENMAGLQGLLCQWRNKIIHALTQSQSQRPSQTNGGEIFTEKMEM
ncbi:hypothetical protein BN131_2139 [Cronobacter malonaticus 681]|nr:hypothetical protein BN131_2139 [Cronobacter malonaticus 681]